MLVVNGTVKIIKMDHSQEVAIYQKLSMSLIMFQSLINEIYKFSIYM